MRTPQSKPSPNWKAIILASPDWPEDLTIPQNDQLPEDSECIQDSMCTNEHWDWELWRHPRARNDDRPRLGWELSNR